MTIQAEANPSTVDGHESGSRRLLYAAIVAIVAVAALVLIVTRPSGNDSAASSQDSPAEVISVVTPASEVANQNFSAVLPSCCYPLPTVPADTPVPPA